MDSETTGLSIEQFLGILRRRAPWILLCVAIVAGAVYGVSKHKVKQYSATAAIVFNNNPLSQQIAGLAPSSGGNNNLAAQQDNNLELVRLGDMAAKTATLLGHGLTAERVRVSLSISARGETNIVNVSAKTTSPSLAAAIANTYVKQFVEERQGANRQFFKSALALVNRQLARLSPAQRVGSDGLDLQNRAHTLTLLAQLGYNNAQVAEEASVPTSPSSPKPKSDTILGAVVGLIIGLGIALLLERLDRRIRRPEDLEAIYRLPLLGVVPKSSALARAARHDARASLPPIEAESFSLIRAHLRFFNVDHDVRTVVIVSPVSGDGKTTIARHMAEAAARLGSRVLLMEVDLRYPTLAQQLDIQAGPGLTDVLIGDMMIGEAIQAVGLQEIAGGQTREHRLDVLTAGAVVPPNPGEMLESDAMSIVLEYARSAYDLVVIDTPPLTAVSDALPLLRKIDGVVVTGMIGHSRSDSAERLHQVLVSSGAPLLGIVANGSKKGAPSPYEGDGRSSTVAVSVNHVSS